MPTDRHTTIKVMEVVFSIEFSIEGHHVPGEYRYRDLVLQVGEISNWRQKNRESHGARTTD
jgi:hypothetical protein